MSLLSNLVGMVVIGGIVLCIIIIYLVMVDEPEPFWWLEREEDGDL